MNEATQPTFHEELRDNIPKTERVIVALAAIPALATVGDVLLMAVTREPFPLTQAIFENIS